MIFVVSKQTVKLSPTKNIYPLSILFFFDIRQLCQMDIFLIAFFSAFLPGIKFIVLVDPRQSGIDALLRKIYEIYSDFALKNPFYSLEMPIR